MGLVIASVSAGARLYALAVGLGALAASGVGAFFRSWRIRRLLTTHRWETHPVRPPLHALDRSIVVTDVHPDDGVYQLSATRPRDGTVRRRTP